MNQEPRTWGRSNNGTDLVKSHPILDQQRDSGVEIAHVPFEDKVPLGLAGYPALEFPETFLS